MISSGDLKAVATIQRSGARKRKAAPARTRWSARRPSAARGASSPPLRQRRSRRLVPLGEEAELEEREEEHEQGEEVGDGSAVAHLVLAEALLVHVERQGHAGAARTRAAAEEDVGLPKDLEGAEDGEDQA